MIKFLDLQALTQKYHDEIYEAVKRTVDSGWYLLGREVQEFEAKYASYIGTNHCVGCANGLDALILMFRALVVQGVLKEGDEVLVPANTFIATIHGITENGLRPLFVDARADNGQIDESQLAQALTPRTRALLLVHLYGQCALTPGIEAFVKQHQLILLEDNAQAHGCLYRGRRTGALGALAAHSFYPGKNLGALGDGGAITTNSKELAKLIRSLANYGYSEKYVCEHKGRNSRLDEIQAAILKVKLSHLESDIQARRAIANYYLAHINHPLIAVPSVPTATEHVFHLFPIRTTHRDALQSYLRNSGVETLIHYPIPPHKQQCYATYQHLVLPTTEAICQEILSLPISPVMSLEDAKRVVSLLNRFDAKS